VPAEAGTGLLNRIAASKRNCKVQHSGQQTTLRAAHTLVIDDVAVDVASPNGGKTYVLPEPSKILDVLRPARSSCVAARRTMWILGTNPELATRWIDATYHFVEASILVIVL
jgi:hypothetical protein